MGADPAERRAGLAARFAEFERTAGSRAPLYARLAPQIARDDDLLGLLDAAPEEQRLPVLLFAAVHLLVLEGGAGRLADHYTTAPHRGDGRRPPDRPTSVPDVDPFEAFRAVALDHGPRIREIVATRVTQTNEIGRCAWFMPLAAEVAAETGPLALVDVGSSAGLNLLLHRYAYEYAEGEGQGAGEAESARRLHPPGATGRTPVIRCTVRGGGPDPWPWPSRLPEIVHAAGIDTSPVDLSDSEAIRWLQACVWPGMDDRFERLTAAIDLARTDPPLVLCADAVDGITAQVVAAHGHGHPLVLSSWVLNYLPVGRQRDFVERLDALGAGSDLSWVIAESPAETPGLPVPTTSPREDLTVVSIVRWRGGRRRVERRATAHPHGYWVRADRA